MILDNKIEIFQYEKETESLWNNNIDKMTHICYGIVNRNIYFALIYTRLNGLSNVSWSQGSHYIANVYVYLPGFTSYKRNLYMTLEDEYMKTDEGTRISKKKRKEKKKH